MIRIVTALIMLLVVTPAWADIYDELEDRSVEQWEKARELTIRAMNGEAAAQFSLGHLYRFSLSASIPTNLSLAEFWYKKAADQGHGEAAYQLGLMFTSGPGKIRDLSVGRQWYRQAAALEYAPAMVALGNLYRDGVGISVNYVHAYKWYRIALSRGSKIARMYSDEVTVHLSRDQITKAHKLAQEWWPARRDTK